MKNTLNLFIFLIYITSISVQANERVIKEKIFGDISIREVSISENGKINNKLIVQHYTAKLTPTTSDIKAGNYLPWHPVYTKPLLNISNDQLPVTEDDCDNIDARLCSSSYMKSMEDTCNNICFSGDPEFISYDKNAQIIYFSVAASNSGSAGYSSFIFSANLNDKKVKLLKSQFNLDEVTLSPSGRYLSLSGLNEIVIFDTKNHHEISIGQDDAYDEGREKSHYLSDVKWLSDSKITYQEGIRHNKFQTSFDEVNENIYDIAMQKIVASKVLPHLGLTY